jgi:catechol 2,3-dioxygenase-like lactoylglutathione lyase family enzyme
MTKEATPVTPPVLHLAHLNLTVRDVDRSVAFYRQWFGFSGSPRLYPDGTVFVTDADGFDLALHPGDPPQPAAPAVHFGFRCNRAEEARRVHASLAAAGIPITESYDAPDHVSVKCLDPDGYVIEVYWEPLETDT